MLTELAVRNLGVIDELSLLLNRGMTAVTGETGAGKTLVVNAIDLLTGGRGNTGLVRPGADHAEVEGRFIIEGGDADGQSEVVVRRVVPRKGRSRCYVKGRLATVGQLAELGRTLVDLHGQHAHQLLLRTATQRSALDRFGSVDASPLAELTGELRAIDARLEALGGDERARAREIDLLRYQLAEIDGADIEGPDEDERLDRLEAALADVSAGRAAGRAAVELLDADGPVADGLGRAAAAVEGRVPYAALEERIADAAAEIADIAAEARILAESLEDDPAALEQVRERRNLLAGLRRKYGPSLAEVIEFGAEVERRLGELERREETAAALNSRRSKTAAELDAQCERVRRERISAAPRLAASVQAHLADLAMGAARFEIAVDGAAGEHVKFLLAANPGHEPRPLARTASGGELARAMLALRLVLVEGPPTLVFDEVDAGVGGAAAHAVGRSLAALTGEHQVLVVTHLAQVAAHADHHVLVEKSDDGAARSTGARILDDNERMTEMSRMLSGSPHSTAARRHAHELLTAAESARASEPAQDS